MNKKILLALIVTVALASTVLVGGGVYLNDQNNDLSKVSQSEMNYINSFIESKMEEGLSASDINQVEKVSNSNLEIEKVDILYDLKNQPNFILVEYSPAGYAIIFRNTGTVYERNSESISPYASLKTKKFYAGPFCYFYQNNAKIIDLKNLKTITQEEVNSYSDYTDRITTNDMKENGILFFDTNEIETMSSSGDTNSSTKNNPNRTRSKYFKSSGTLQGNYFQSLKVKKIQGTSKIYNDLSYEYAIGKYDVIFPNNTSISNSCAAVTGTMVLQFYDRMNIRKTISDNYKNSYGITTKTDLYSVTNNRISQAIGTRMHDSILDLATGGVGKGPVSSKDLKKGVDKYLSNNGLLAVTSKSNTFYDNMSGAVDSGNLAIGMTGFSGDGYFENNGWNKTPVSKHHLVVYGYTTNSKNKLDEFICHANWFSLSDNGMTSKTYVYKMAFFSNLTFSV